MSFEEDLETVDEMLEEARERMNAATDEVRILIKQKEELLTDKYKSMSDEELRADDKLFMRFIKDSGHNTEAYDRINAMSAVKSKSLWRSGTDGRQEYYAYPCLTLVLAKDEAVEAIAEEFRAWHAEWALGREMVQVDILEYSASEHGSWSAHYWPATDTMQVLRLRWGRKEALKSGKLEDALRYVAENAWFRDENDDY